MKRTSTYFAKPGEVAENWKVVDATGQTLGRLARDIAVSLLGKDKPTYTPHTLTGDFVVVLNAAKVRVTGRKTTQKMYYRHSGYVGNLKTIPAAGNARKPARASAGVGGEGYAAPQPPRPTDAP